MKELNFNAGKINYDENYHEIKFNRLMNDKDYYNIKAKLAKKEYFKAYFEENSKVLEFGCGLGQNLGMINNKFGLDLNKKLYPLLEKSGIKMFKKLSDIPDNYFDEIILSQVLEHLEDPMQILKKLNKKLKPGGKLRIVLPKVNYNKVELNKTIDGHIYGWGFYEINYLLNRCGFEVIYNKIIYRRGIDKLYFLSKINFNLYYVVTKLYGRIVNDFDILVIAKK